MLSFLIVSILVLLFTIAVNGFSLKLLNSKGILRSYASIFMSIVVILLTLSSFLSTTAITRVILRSSSDDSFQPKLDKSEIAFALWCIGTLIADMAGFSSLLMGISVLFLLIHNFSNVKTRFLTIILCCTNLTTFSMCLAVEISSIIGFYKEPKEPPVLSSLWVIPFAISTCIPQIGVLYHLHKVLWSKHSESRQTKLLGKCALASSIVAICFIVMGSMGGFSGDMIDLLQACLLHVLSYFFYSITVRCLSILVFQGAVCDAPGKNAETTLSRPATMKSEMKLDEFRNVSVL